MAKYQAYILITKSYKQRFSSLQYGTIKKAKEAATKRAKEYMQETGNPAIIEKVKLASG